MKEEWAKVKEGWRALSLREKQTVAGGAVALFIIIFYQFAFTPLLQKTALMRKRIAVEQKDLAWMQSANKVMQQMESSAKSNKEAVSTVILMSGMQKIINRAGCSQSLTQLKQSANDSIELQFQKIEFDKLMKVFLTVANQYRIIITQATITAENAPGMVSAEVIVKGGEVFNSFSTARLQ